MALPLSPSDSPRPPQAQFPTTHWNVVLAAGGTAAPEAEAALERLCKAYWFPLYSFLRRLGHAPHDAQDLTQSFFARLLESNALQSVDRRKGRFRSFLLASLKHFLANEQDRANAIKRGRAVSFVSWEGSAAEERYRRTESLGGSPDKAFEQVWATTLLEQVLGRLRSEQVEAGRGALFEALQIYVVGDKGLVPYAEMAARLGLGESALKMTVQRLRRRFGELLRAEVARTVGDPDEIDEEIRALFAAVSQ